MNGYNFTERVRKVLAQARDEAANLRYEYVGTEHILLGLLREGGGVACTMLTNLNADLDALRDTVLTAMKPSSATLSGPDLPYTSRAKKVLELSMVEAREVNHSYVGTEHLLLGLLREEKGLAAQVLHSFGITTENARAEMRRVLGEPIGDGSSPQTPGAPAKYVPQYSARLTEILTSAYNVAASRGTRTVTHAHITIALLEHKEGMANATLDRLGLDRAAAITALTALTPADDPSIGPNDAMDSRLLTSTFDSMERFQRDTRAATPGSHHLLFGLLATSSEVAAVFAAQHIDLARVRDEAQRISG